MKEGEGMAVLSLTRASQLLAAQTTVTVVLPDSLPAKPLRTLWLFHGLGDDGSGWLRKTLVEPLALKAGIAVVMPAMGRSFYRNQPGRPYGDYLTQEVIGGMRQLLPLSPAPQDNFVAGNSMGGFGALQLACAHPDWFSAVAAFSPVCDLSVLPSIMPDYGHVFPGALPADLLYQQFRQADAAKLKQLRWFHAEGDQDFMKAANDRFDTFLSQKLQLPVTYQQQPGSHDWFYWAQALEAMFTWLFDVKETNR